MKMPREMTSAGSTLERTTTEGRKETDAAHFILGLMNLIDIKEEIEEHEHGARHRRRRGRARFPPR